MPFTEHLPGVTPNAGRFAPWHSSRQQSGAGDGGTFDKDICSHTLTEQWRSHALSSAA